MILDDTGTPSPIWRIGHPNAAYTEWTITSGQRGLPQRHACNAEALAANFEASRPPC